MDKGTGAGRHARADVGWVAAYRPPRLDGARWTEVRPFVVDCAGRLGVDCGSGGRDVVRALTRLSAWATAEGLPLDVEVVLDPDTVERFIAAGIPDVPLRSRATYRATLRRVGPLLTTRAPWEAKAAPVARRHVAAPYTPADIDGFRADAAAQPTAIKRRAARALLALGAGAGLDGRWVATVTAKDVTTDKGVVLVRVGEPAPRMVPVLHTWEDEIVDLAATAGDAFLIGGYSTARNRVNVLTKSLVLANGRPRINAARLRSTWLLTHLTMGTRLPELAHAAGLQGITVLSDLLEFVPCLDAAAAQAMLRGSR